MSELQEQLEQSKKHISILQINKALGLVYDPSHPMPKVAISTLLSQVKTEAAKVTKIAEEAIVVHRQNSELNFRNEQLKSENTGIIIKNEQLQVEVASWRRMAEKLHEQVKPCLHCQHTGWIHTEDDIPDQMCPYCFVGKAVCKCYDKTVKVQLGDHEQLKAELDKLRWILVSEGLPEDHERCLWLPKQGIKNKSLVEIGTYYKDSAEYYPKCYSHWMPMPALPEEAPDVPS